MAAIQDPIESHGVGTYICLTLSPSIVYFNVNLENTLVNHMDLEIGQWMSKNIEYKLTLFQKHDDMDYTKEITLAINKQLSNKANTTNICSIASPFF